MTTERHAEQELLMAWNDGALSGAEHAEVGAHVGGCAECRTFVASMGAVGERLAGWALEPASFTAPAPRPAVRPWIGWAAAVAAAVVLVAALTFIARPRQDDTALEFVAAPAGTVARGGTGAVRVEVFGDWLCADCTRSYAEYLDLVTDLSGAGARRVSLVWKDYPWDSTCNPHVGRTVRAGACDAAVAVRLSRELGEGDGLIARFRSGTAGSPYQELRSRIAKMDANPALVIAYERARTGVSRDVAEAQARNIQMTPSVFVNGERLGSQPAPTVGELRAAIETQLQTMRGSGLRGGGGSRGRR